MIPVILRRVLRVLGIQQVGNCLHHITHNEWLFIIFSVLSVSSVAK
jgi:hypothetical protein